MFNSKIAKYYLIWLLAIILIFYFGFLFIQHSETASNHFFENFSNWDGKYYLSIAEKGYFNNVEYAFFPIYPISIKLVGLLVGNLQLSAIFISATSSYLAIMFLFKLISFEFNKSIAERSVVFLLIFPTSFFLLTSYSESLFLVFSISSFYFFRKEKYIRSALTAAVAAITRPEGILILVAFWGYIFLNGGPNRKNWILIFAPLGLAGYLLYLYSQTGDPLYFLTSQMNWQRSFSAPWVTIWQTIHDISQPNFIDRYYYVPINLLFAILGLGLAIRSFRFLPIIFSIYAFGSILLPLASSTLASIPRFLITVFPLFILLALIKNKIFIRLYIILSLLMLPIFAIVYFNGFWIS